MTTKFKKLLALGLACVFALSTMATTAFAQEPVNNHMEFVGIPVTDGASKADMAFLSQVVDADTFDSSLETTVFVFLDSNVLNDTNARGYLYSAITPQHLRKMKVAGKAVNVVDEAMVNSILSSKPDVSSGARAICIHSYKNSGSPSYETTYTKSANKSCRIKREYQYQVCSKCGAGKTTNKIVQEFPHEWIPYTTSGYAYKCNVCGIAKK